MKNILTILFLFFAINIFSQKIYIKEIKISSDLTYPLLITEDNNLLVNLKKINLSILNEIFDNNLILSENSIKNRLIEEQNDSQTEPYGYLEFLGYRVLFNTDEIFTFEITNFRHTKGTDYETKQYSINVNNGTLIKSDDIFNSDFHKVIDSKIKNEFNKRLVQSLKKYKEKNGDDGSLIDEEFKIENGYKDFSLSKDGIYLIYENEIFSLSNRDCWPSEFYFFSWDEIRAALKVNSPIKTIIK